MRWRGVAGRAVAGAVVAVAVGLLGAGCAAEGAGAERRAPGSGQGSGPRSSQAGPATPVTPSTPSTQGGRTGEGQTGGGAGKCGAVGQVVYFSTAPSGVSNGHLVLADRAGALRYAAAFGAAGPGARASVEAAVEGTDFGRQVLVGWTTTTGCSAATGAELAVAGGRLELRVSQPEQPPECVVADRLSVVFRVARERVPADPVFG